MSKWKLYYQMFNIHAWFKEEMYHCVTIFLKNKHEEQYTKAFAKLKKESPFILNPNVSLIL